MPKDERFVYIQKEGSELVGNGARILMVDRVTNVTYLIWRSGYAGGITPLLASDGQVVLTPLNDDDEYE